MPVLLHGLGYRPEVPKDEIDPYAAKDAVLSLDQYASKNNVSIGKDNVLTNSQEEQPLAPQMKDEKDQAEKGSVHSHSVTSDPRMEIQNFKTHCLAKLTETVASKSARGGRQPSGRLTLGSPSPFPTLLGPSIEECQRVHDLLSAEHGQMSMLENIPPPSQTVAGCGEVNFVLEALIRTLISTHTHMSNADKAIEQLCNTFRVFKSGDYAGSVDWEDVRVQGHEALEIAIRPAGKSVKTSKAIVSILQSVKEENDVIREWLHTSPRLGPRSAKSIGQLTRAEILAHTALRKIASDPNFLSLDYLHLALPRKVFEHLQRYPEVGVKTAACILLFCLQIPTLAVDTHVWRISKLLSWIPVHADRDQTFFHLDRLVPDKLKYGLHQLLIAHGKACARCNGRNQYGTTTWHEADCTLKDLVSNLRASSLLFKSQTKKKVINMDKSKKQTIEPKKESESKKRSASDAQLYNDPSSFIHPSMRAQSGLQPAPANTMVGPQQPFTLPANQGGANPLGSNLTMGHNPAPVATMGSGITLAQAVPVVGQVVVGMKAQARRREQAKIARKERELPKNHPENRYLPGNAVLPAEYRQNKTWRRRSGRAKKAVSYEEVPEEDEEEDEKDQPEE